MIEAVIHSNAKRRFDRRSLLFCIFSFCMVATLSFLIAKSSNFVDAGKLDNFRPGNIISDYVMSNYKSMTEAEIQAFLKSKNSCNDTRVYLAKQYSSYQYHIENGHFVCMADEKFNGETAAHIIWQAAQDYRINPQVLIVLLQKEQGLVTDTWPNNIQYRAATGYGCPDTAACDSKYYGFKNQVRRAAEMFRSVLDGGWTNYPVGNNYIQYNPNAACGGTMVRIENRATSSLYRYTPYQPNASALSAGYGTGDGCGAYGNRNFYLYFLDWFGNPQGFSAVQSNLPTGDYLLALNDDYAKTIQLEAKSTTNGAKLVLATRGAADTFTLTKNANNTYTLVNQYSGKAIDIPNGSATTGVTLQQYESNGTPAQQWYLYDNADGTYSIGSSLKRELVLTIDQDEESSSYQKLTLSHYSYGAGQSFRIIPTKQLITDGTYFINSGLGSNLTIDVAGGSTANSANVQTYTLNRTDAQKFALTFDKESGTYTIINIKSNKAVDVAGGGTKNGANIQIYTSNQSNAQRWYIFPLSNDKYEIISAHSNKAIDIAGGNRTPASNIQIYQRNSSIAQSWSFITETELPDTLEGIYKITSSLKADFVLDVAGGNRKNGARIQLYSANGTEAQRWQLVHNLSDDSYTIINPISNLALDVAGGSVANGASIQLYSQNRTDAQKWFIEPTADGYYEIISVKSGKSVDVANGSKANGTSAQIYTRNNTAAQKWILTKE